MENKVLVVAAAALMSSAGALHPESANAADAIAPAYEDSTIDASLDPGEERVSAAADNQARLKDLRYAYFIGYNARAREDSTSYSTLADEVKHPQKQFAVPAPPLSASPKPLAERVAPPRRVVVQAAPIKQVTAPVVPAKRSAAARAVPSRQVVARADPVPVKRVPAKVAALPQKHVYAQVEVAPPKRVSAPVASLKQASMPVMSPRRVEVQPVAVKQVSVRTTPSKLFAPSSQPPILIPTQTVTALPDEKSDSDDEPQVAQSRHLQNAQRGVPQHQQADEESQYAAEQGNQAAQAAQAAKNPQARQYQNRQSQQYAAATAYDQGSTESQASGHYSGREYAPPPLPALPVQANRYAPAQYPATQYQPAYAQSAYVPRPPPQTAAQQVVIVARPPAYPAYPAYNQMYTPPELRRPYPGGYGNSAQPAGYQGWE